MSVINNGNSKFHRYPIVQAIIATILIVATVVGVLFVVSFYEGQNADHEDKNYLYRQSKAQLVQKIRQQQKVLDKAVKENTKNENLLIDAYADLTVVRKESDELVRKVRHIENLELFMCGDGANKKEGADQLIFCLGILKVALAENLQASGRLPTSITDLGFSNDFTQNSLIKSISFKPDGTIMALVEASFGADKYLSLKPKLRNYSIQSWTCETNMDKKVFQKYQCK